MKRACLLRHGLTRANLHHLYCGAADLPLCDEGRRALEALRRERQYPEISGLRVFTSGLLRTEETLEALYGALPHEQLPAFREMAFGVFELHGYEELKEDPAYRAWISGDNAQNICPGGESGAEMTRRVLAAWETLERGKDILLISHGGPIAAIMAALFPEEGRNRYAWQPQNGCGYLLERETEQARWRWREIPT